MSSIQEVLMIVPPSITDCGFVSHASTKLKLATLRTRHGIFLEKSATESK